MNYFSPNVRLAQSLADSIFQREVIAGLSREPKCIPCKYFYDDAGSALFDRICDVPEYYPTRTETMLLRALASDFAKLAGPNAELIEFGAGALKKTRFLLDALEQPQSYVPVDIAGDYLRHVAEDLARAYPHLTVKPIIADFTKPIMLGLKRGPGRRIGFFPGSTIGNFSADEAVRFLARTALLLKGGGLLVGIDLVKDPAILHGAYNDAEGVTAAFNKNLLLRINRELEADFDLEKFSHYAFYNPVWERIEMHLVSAERQAVHIAGRCIEFEAGESIHTEDSHKYSVEGFQELAREAGFSPREVWCDEDRLFSVHWLES
jgi:dimethylhistidine N-methyltransferase